MDKDQNRDIYLDKLDELCNLVELNNNFMDSLRKCECFVRNMAILEVFTIFLVLVWINALIVVNHTRIFTKLRSGN